MHNFYFSVPLLLKLWLCDSPPTQTNYEPPSSASVALPSRCGSVVLKSRATAAAAAAADPELPLFGETLTLLKLQRFLRSCVFRRDSSAVTLKCAAKRYYAKAVRSVGTPCEVSFLESSIWAIFSRKMVTV
ncbi:hypothetical protein Q5P01_014981 [Channa striata]|uniref:Secreted protein n=1 Tax=Channa striata TaxID=64152 RepID=A0AA88MGV5_CHASR|nr:hypothetical protein Q5P01_014981 [Channa striata]